MKLHLLSDLHIEFGFWPYPAIDADVVVLAGDIHVGTKGVEWALEQIKGKPVLYVLGNHEYYRQTYPKLLSQIKALAEGTHVQVLENEVTTIDGVNFFGCTLWTDFALQGDPRVAGYQCMQVMNDFKKIRRMPNYAKMRSLDLAAIHQTSLNWLAAQLSEHQGQKNVVISHHGPHVNSLPEYRRAEMISSAYVSNLTRFINKHQPNLWLHGHVHHACDHRVGNCRVVCNPKGYPGKIAAGFAADLVVDV